MSEVKRYDCDISTKRDELEEGCLCEAVMDETTVGDYVTYDDYLTLQRERDELLELKKWKDAIQDAQVVDWCLDESNKNDPRKAVNDLLCYAQRIALDPTVCEDATKLRDTYKQQRDDLQAIVDKLADVFHFDSVSQDHYEQGGGDEYDLELSDCYGKLADETWKELYKMVRAAEAAKNSESSQKGGKG